MTGKWSCFYLPAPIFLSGLPCSVVRGIKCLARSGQFIPLTNLPLTSRLADETKPGNESAPRFYGEIRCVGPDPGCSLLPLQQREDEEHEEDEDQHLGDGRGEAAEAAETKDAGEDGDDEEDNGVVEHGFGWFRFRRRAAGRG